eukprot:GILK01015408.1.p1 GENE.GILK01015408.1~~GILK01015408.1.p1  ORF type:complete len:635 (+),score=74.57 GILK01015408.1:89-1906(+)
MAAAVSGVMSFAVAAGPVMLALVGDPTNVEVQAVVAMFSAEACATVDEIEAARIARYVTLSPFYDLGADVVVLAHIGIIAAVAAFQVVVAMAIVISDRNETLSSSLQRVMFPHISYVVASVLFTGLCFSSFELVVTETGSKLAVGAVGVAVASVILVATIAVIALHLLGYVDVGAVFLSYGIAEELDLTEEVEKQGGCARALACYDKPAIRKWAWPRGTFAPVVTRRAYSSILFATVPTRLAVAPYPLIMSLVTTLLLHVGKETAAGSESAFKCSYRWIALAVWFAAFAIMLAVFKPHRAIANSHAAALSYVLLLVIAGLSAAENSPEIGRDTGSLFTAKIVLALILLIVGFARTVHSLLFILWLERPAEEKAISKQIDDTQKLNEYAVGEELKYAAEDLGDEDLFVQDSPSKDVTLVAAPPVHLSETDDSSSPTIITSNSEKKAHRKGSAKPPIRASVVTAAIIRAHFSDSEEESKSSGQGIAVDETHKVQSDVRSDYSSASGGEDADKPTSVRQFSAAPHQREESSHRNHRTDDEVLDVQPLPTIVSRDNENDICNVSSGEEERRNRIQNDVSAPDAVEVKDDDVDIDDDNERLSGAEEELLF